MHALGDKCIERASTKSMGGHGPRPGRNESPVFLFGLGLGIRMTPRKSDQFHL